jgi:hypothetical protein
MVQTAKSMVQTAKCMVQTAKCMVQTAKRMVQTAKCMVQTAKSSEDVCIRVRETLKIVIFFCSGSNSNVGPRVIIPPDHAEGLPLVSISVSTYSLLTQQ